jgi:glycosyltransferase involved in cell wall biosynthesis
MKISLALPFHNEEGNLVILLPLIVKNLTKNPNFDFEVNLVDDLSDDESYEVCKRFIESNKSLIEFNLFKLEKKGFQYGALKKGFEESTGDYIICMDSDLQDDPRHLSKFIQNINNNFEIIVGIRINRKAPSILKSGLKVYDLIFEKIFKKKLVTYRAQFAAYKSKYVKNLPWFKNDHRYLIPIAIHRGANLITGVNFEHKPREIGKSHYNRYLKVFSGIIELGIFLYRMKTGKYK